MKFRDEDKLRAIVVRDNSVIDFEKRLNDLDKYYDLIDLQYSTTTYSNNDIEYSALALVRRK